MNLHEFSTTFAAVCLLSIVLGGIVIPFLQDRYDTDVDQD